MSTGTVLILLGSYFHPMAMGGPRLQEGLSPNIDSYVRISNCPNLTRSLFPRLKVLKDDGRVLMLILIVISSLRCGGKKIFSRGVIIRSLKSLKNNWRKDNIFSIRFIVCSRLLRDEDQLEETGIRD